MTGVSGATKQELDKAGKASEAVLIEMWAEGKEIQQEQSYVAGDAIYCIYHAASADGFGNMQNDPMGWPLRLPK